MSNRNYTKNELIFAGGWLVVWLLLNFLFLGFRVNHPVFQLLTAFVLAIELSFVFAAPLFRKMVRGWTLISHKIGQLNTRLILGAIFYLVFTPAALMLRLIKKDLLDRRRNPGAPGYWQDRPRQEKSTDDYRRLF